MRRAVLVILLLSFLTVGFAIAVNALPEGAQVSEGRRETRTAPTADTVQADGGNVSEVNISASTQTSLWQGFFGQVNGSLVLQDASGDTFYAWNLTNTTGEIYAARDSAVDFSTIEPQGGNCSADNILTGVGLSDSANNTYKSVNNVAITVGTVTINASTACAAQPYVSSVPNSDNWHDMTLTDNAATLNDTIYATPVEGDLTGYDGGTYDYQLLVPVNTSTGFLTYSFYAELG